jgi:hypothetical protein
LLFVAAFSQRLEAVEWGRSRLEQQFGSVGLESIPFDFVQTRYYERSMGKGLRKRFCVFCELVAPEILAEVKRFSNALEAQLAAENRFPENRPLNLDPGFLTLGKVMLATTKDQAHRIYLRDGIFAEVTLRYEAGAYQPWPWTYADYRQPDVLAFFQQARDYYRRRLRERNGSRP